MKKLATILALTAVVANLGVAVVFAQENVAGSQLIGCADAATGQALAVSWTDGPGAPVSFEGKYTNWFDDANTDAAIVLDTFIYVDTTDDRGWDPAGVTCGTGGRVDISSLGLDHPTVTQNLAIGLGTVTEGGDFTWQGASHDPADVAEVVGVVHAAAQDLTTALQMVTFTKAWSGTVRMTFDGSQLHVNTPTTPIAAGTYTGNVTFTLVPGV